MQVGSSAADVHTSSKATVHDNIRMLYGSAVSRDLLELKVDRMNQLEFKASGCVLLDLSEYL